jgi:hypothetical protein
VQQDDWFAVLGACLGNVHPQSAGVDPAV